MSGPAIRTFHLVAATIVTMVALACGDATTGRYTTRGADIIDPSTRKPVLLTGFGLGGWLLPEGYMWGIRTLDRPRQFEAAIEDLIGPDNADEFWRLYHDNFVTASDFEAMSAFGANSVRIPLLASKLQPRDTQPDSPPYTYSEEGFRFLDSVMVWAGRYEIGVIWDMHGAPGGQNAENISDSDGEARLWTQKETYWPRLIDLWYQIAARYSGRPEVIGYDLLNEPLLRRYQGVDPRLLRELYVILTDTIRAVDSDGLIFVEGDDWAQEFSMLEPLDWDSHLVIAFHSYPPTSTAAGLSRWDSLRTRYQIPLWHGETGEQSPPFDGNRRATKFLLSANVGWSWWTHKKLERRTQPWLCFKTDGFQRILDYWMGRAERPSPEEARDWLFEMARQTQSDYCEFSADMVASLETLDPQAYLNRREPIAPAIFQQPIDASVEVGSATTFQVRALGFPLTYVWRRNGETIENASGPVLSVVPKSTREDGDVYTITVFNSLGTIESNKVTLTVRPFAGPSVPLASSVPDVDGLVDGVWTEAPRLRIDNQIADARPTGDDLSASFRILRSDTHLYLLIEVADDVLVNTDPRDYHNDGIELYLDPDNDKSVDYGDDDFMLRFNVGQEMIVHRGNLAGGVVTAESVFRGGYRIEIGIPWSAIRAESRGPYIGLDVQVNDNDSDRRESKLSWHATRDNAYLTPAAFGTVSIDR